MSLNILSSNFIIYCKKWHKTVEFYRDKLDLPVNFQNEWFFEFILNSSSRLSIADERKASIKSSNGLGITISLKTEDINIKKTQLEAKKLVIPAISRHSWGALVFYIYDPEGNRIEFWQEL